MSETVGIKTKVQKLGRALSGMVMPNIGAFIAWGFITALFIEKGWLPNAQLAEMITPMLKYVLPVLIGYTGGKIKRTPVYDLKKYKKMRALAMSDL